MTNPVPLKPETSRASRAASGDQPTSFPAAFVVVLLVTITFPLAPEPLPAEEDVSFVEAVREAPSRMTDLPQNDETRRLLEVYKPKLHVDPESYHPMGFYRDYLPNTVLEDGNGNVLVENPGRTDLRRYDGRDDLHLNFQRSVETVLEEPPREPVPVYGRVYADTLTHAGESVPLLFLKYNVAFPYSGLPAGNGWWKEAGARLLGDPWAWHELDIHGAVHVILHGESRRPLGVLLAQHNHHRTHLRTEDFEWPEDDRVTISYATRSNEPYLITDRLGSRLEPTVGNPSHVRTLHRPERTRWRGYSAGYDRILAPGDGAVRIRTELHQFPHDDPLYTSALDLGDHYKLLGLVDTWFRQGPPGMDYYASPALKDLADLAAFWSINPEDDQFFDLLGEDPDFFDEQELRPVLNYQRKRFLERIKKVIRKAK